MQPPIVLCFIACCWLLVGASGFGTCGDSDEAVVGAAPGLGSWRTYRSDWFSVRYPESFAVRESLASEDGGFDSVFFDAPDGRASFYVLSPQWGRRATDVELRPDRERQVRVEETETGRGSRTVRTFAAKDGRRTRIVEENSEEGGSVYWVTAFEYEDEVARRSYREAYERFKASLEQYAD